METVVPPPVDEELHLLTEWGDPNAPARRRKAVIGTILVHAAVITVLMYLPAGPYEPNVPEEPPHHVTPLILPPTELTQKAPNKGKVTKEFDAREEAPRHAINTPPSPPRVAPRPAAPRPAVTPAPPAPKAETPVPPAPEPPKVEAPKAAPKVETPQVAQTPQQLPPQIQTQEKPKIPLENVPPPASHVPPGLPRIAIPSTAVNDVARDVIRGSSTSEGLTIGDQGALGSGYGGMNQSPTNGKPGAALQLLSDPQGADFLPYIRQILQTIKRNWLAVQPESVRMGRRGKVVVQFVVRKDGVVDKVVFEEHSGADPLDRAAVAGISASNPLPALPPEFKGDRIVLRLNFMYNMPR
ncbi:MAG TPA: TonB family protein [Candidatus Sulfopaludibacter sp.]|jgi:TonB family protein|nr:TonB family protein [Candidatus Sulfopaludibacter sp.]